MEYFLLDLYIVPKEEKSLPNSKNGRQSFRVICRNAQPYYAPTPKNI